MGALDWLIERNRGAATAFAPRRAPRLCVVTCDDAALTVQLEQCLGLLPGEAAVIRLPGGGGAFFSSALERAVAKATLVEGCPEVLLVSHSSCTIQGTAATTLAEAIARAPAGKLPPELPEQLGLGRDPRAQLREVRARLRQSALLPTSLPLHLGHLDEATGQLQLLEGENAVSVPTSVPNAEDAGPLQVSGYRSGPVSGAELAPAPLPFENALSTPLNLSVELPALTVALPSVTQLPSVTLQLPAVTQLPSITVALPAVTQLPSVTVQLPMAIELPALSVQLPTVGELPSVTVQLPALGDLSTLGVPSAPSDAVALPPTNVVAPRPLPSAPRAPAPQATVVSPPPLAKVRRTQQPAPSPASSAAPARASTGIEPALAQAMEKVRAFVLAELPRRKRQDTLNALVREAGLAATAPELVKLAMQPLLALGDARYRVLDELILVKEELSRLPSPRAVTLLQSLLQ